RHRFRPLLPVTTMRTTGWILALVTAAAACSNATAPANPTWADDVQPIIQGNCSHCHGSSAKANGMNFRFDICDAAAFIDTGVTLPPSAGASNMVMAALIKNEITPHEGERAFMPPPPASPLPDFERDTLINWVAKHECGNRKGNHKPKAKLVGKLDFTDGN